MDDLQNQISELRNQLQQINQVIEAIPKQVISGLVSHGSTSNFSQDLNNNLVDSPSPYSINHVSRESLEYNFSHKDILEEDSAYICQGDQIPCEWQVGRLTAQLTYAYERIAALEKQLLSRHLASL